MEFLIGAPFHYNVGHTDCRNECERVEQGSREVFKVLPIMRLPARPAEITIIDGKELSQNLILELLQLQLGELCPVGLVKDI